MPEPLEWRDEKAAVPLVHGTAAWFEVGLFGWLFWPGTNSQRLVAAVAVRGRRLGHRLSGSDPAGGGGVPEGRDLGRFDALGKLGLGRGAVEVQ